MSSKVSELLQTRVDQLAQAIAGLPADSQQSLGPVLAGLGQLSELAGQQELLLETAAAISDAAGSIANVDELLDISANIIQNHFGFAQVLIFLTTRTEKWAECRAAAGDDSPAGQKIKIDGESLVGRAILQQEPQPAGADADITEAAFPLLNRGRIVGAILVKPSAPQLTPQFVRLFQNSVAVQLANTLQNAILYASADQQLEQLITLHSINLQISNAHHLDKLLADIVDLSAKLVVADACLLRFFDASSQTLQIKAAYRPPAGLHVNTIEPATASLSGHVVLTHEAVLAANWPEHPLAKKFNFGQTVRSVLNVPIHSQDKIVGAIEVLHFSNPQAFNENDLYTLSLLASQTGAAIEKARLYTEAEHSRRFLQTVIDHIPDPIFIKDRHHTWIAMNQANARVLGYAKNKLLGKTDSDFFAPELAAEFYRRDDVVFESNKIFEHEDKTLWADNAEHVAYTRLIPIPGEGGETEYLLGLSHDVTERRAHEAEREQFVAEMSALYTGTQQIATSLSERQIFTALLNQIRRYDPCQIAAYRIRSVHDEPIWLELRDSWTKPGSAAGPAPAQIYLPESPLRDILSAADAVFVEDIAADPRLSAEQRGCFAPAGAHSSAILPLSFIGQKIGVVLVHFTTPASFPEVTRRFWLAMIDQAGMALSNRQLIQEAAYRAIQMETAAEVVRAASSLVDLPSLLKSAAALMLDRFDLYFAGIFLVDGSGEWANLMAGTPPAGPELLAAEYRLKLDDESPIGRCILHRQPNLALDVGQEAVVFNQPYLPETRSEMALPLLYHTKAIGAITLQSRDQAAFSREDIIFLQTMADQLANAIENAMLFQRAQQEIADRQRAEEGLLMALERTESLYRIGNAIASAAREQVLYETVLVEYLRLLNIQPAYGSVLRFEHAKDFSKVRALVVKGRPVPSNLSFSAQQDTVGRHLIEHKTPLVIDDVRRHPLTKTSPRFWQQDEAVQSLVFIPMIMQNTVIGALAVGAEGSGYAFSQNDVEIGQVVADQLTIWLENRELLRAINYRTQRLQTAAEVSQAASSILDVDELINTSVNLIRNSFGFYYVGLFLVDEAREWAVLRAGTGKAGRIQIARKHRLKIGGESMIGWSVANRKARIALDVGEEAVRFVNPVLPDTHSEMALPLISRDEVLGAITVQSTERNAFSNEDITMLQTMADQLANALTNARLFEHVARAQKEAEERLHETAALQQVSQQLAGTLDIDDILDIFFKACISEIGFEYVMLSMVEPASQQIKAWGGVGLSENQLARAVQPLDGGDIMADIVRSGKTEIISGWDPRFNQELYDVEGHANWVRLFTPVVLRHENVGLVEAGFNRSLTATVTDTHVRFLKALISQTVLALDNAKRYRASQQAARREALIKEITTRVRASTNLDTILQTTVKEVGNAIANKRAYIHLAAPPKSNGDSRTGGPANE